MTETEKQKAAAIIKMLGQYLEMYPECKLSTMGLMKYAEVLISYPLEQLKAGMEKAVRKSEYFPKPVHIIGAIEELKAHVSTGGSGIPTWGEAWQEMLKNANRTNSFEKCKFSTPEVKRAVAIFGWKQVFDMMAEDEGTHKAQFRRIYEQELSRVAERKLNNEALAGGKLAGIVDKLANNSTRVFSLEGAH